MAEVGKTNRLNRLALAFIGLPHLGFRMRARIIMARLKNEDNKLKILDAGCGYGLYALMLSELGFQVDAVDIDERRTNIVNQMLDEYPVIKKKVSIYTVSLVNLPFSSNTYDIIICQM